MFVVCTFAISQTIFCQFRYRLEKSSFDWDIVCKCSFFDSNVRITCVERTPNIFGQTITFIYFYIFVVICHDDNGDGWPNLKIFSHRIRYKLMVDNCGFIRGRIICTESRLKRLASCQRLLREPLTL